MNYKELAEVIWNAIIDAYKRKGLEPNFKELTTALGYVYNSAGIFWKRSMKNNEPKSKKSKKKVETEAA